MIGIKHISTYVPSTRIDNVAQAERFGESEDFVRSKIGATKLPRKQSTEETSDIAAAAVRALIDDAELSADEIDSLIVVTQNGDGSGLPHTSALVQYKLGLKHDVAAFDISLGCSGYVYGLSILKGFMTETNSKHGVLVTADPYSKIIDPDDRATTLLFGDAATATWLSKEGEWEIGKPLMATDGSGSANLVVRDGRLDMNGRQVFNFASISVPSQIQALLRRERLVPKDIDLYCLHQGSRAIIDAISRRFKEVRDRFVVDMDETGNTVSSTIPLSLQNYMDDPGVRRILICGFGVGLSWASGILTRRAC